MGKLAFENACNGILERLNAGKTVEEEDFFVFMNSTADLKREEAELSSAYQKLYDTLQRAWHYKDLKISCEENFLLGGVWGVLRLIHEEMEKKQRQKTLNLLVLKYKEQYWFLEEIDRNPGIKHKDLAKKGGKSPSQLSQFFRTIASENLVDYNRIGREKYYYLQQTGKLVYDEIKRRIEKEIRNSLTYAEPSKRISTDNEKRGVSSLIPADWPQEFLSYKLSGEILWKDEKGQKYINTVDNLSTDSLFSFEQWEYGVGEDNKKVSRI